jgi:hypothetical protein
LFTYGEEERKGRLCGWEEGGRGRIEKGVLRCKMREEKSGDKDQRGKKVIASLFYVSFSMSPSFCLSLPIAHHTL